MLNCANAIYRSYSISSSYPSESVSNSQFTGGLGGEMDTRMSYFLKGMIKSNDPDQMQRNLVPERMKQNLIPDFIIKIQRNLVLDDMQ